MAREMYLAGVPQEDLQPAPPPPPMTKRQKWENFWYHEKWLVLGLLAAAIALTVLIVQMATLNRPDYLVMVVTEEGYPPGAWEALGKTLERYGEDLDGDGAVEVQVIDCAVGATTNNLPNIQKLSVHLGAGDVMLYAFVPTQQERFQVTQTDGEVGTFLTPLPFTADGVQADGLSWDWQGDARVTGDAVLAALPERLCFGVRVTGGLGEDSKPLHDQAMALLTAFATNQPTAAPAE